MLGRSGRPGRAPSARRARCLPLTRTHTRSDLEGALAASPDVRRHVRRAAISARAKGLFSTFSKMLKDGRAARDVRDLLGMRLVLDPDQDLRFLHVQRQGRGGPRPHPGRWC